MELSRMEGTAGSNPAGSRPNSRGPPSGRSLELARSAGSMQRAGSAVPSSKRGPVSFRAIKEEKPALQEQVSTAARRALAWPEVGPSLQPEAAWTFI